MKQVESIIAYTLMYHYIISNVLRKETATREVSNTFGAQRKTNEGL